MFFLILAILLTPLLRRKPAPLSKRIIVIQTGKIGDFICATPLIKSLSLAFPESLISVVVTPALSELASELPYIHNIIEFPPNSAKGFKGKLNWIRTIRSKEFDMALCCNGGVTWPGILALAGIPIRIGITPNFLGRSISLAQCLWTAKAQHKGDQLIGATYAQMLLLAGVKNFDPKKEIRIPKGTAELVLKFLQENTNSEDSLLIGIAISSANKLKELGTPLLTEICRGILTEHPNALLVFLGTNSDREEANHILELLSPTEQQRALNTCGQFSLAQIPGLLSKLSVFLGVDSGLTYIADTLEIPLVSIAGPCNMLETRPTNPSAVIIQHDLSCAPCAHIFRAPYSCQLGTRDCINGITASEVVTQISLLCNRTLLPE